MSTFDCGHCGASLAIPADRSALEARCTFCGNETILPAEILRLRAPPSVERLVELPVVTPDPGPIDAGASKAAPWLAVTLGALLVAGLGGAASFTARRPVDVEPVEERRRQPAPPVSERAVDRPRPGQERAKARLAELSASGCQEIILAPTRTSGDQTIETKLAANGRCVMVLAMADAPDNLLGLSIQTPSGEDLPAPAPAPDVELLVCPKARGSHSTRITPSTAGGYAVAAVECLDARRR